MWPVVGRIEVSSFWTTPSDTLRPSSVSNGDNEQGPGSGDCTVQTGPCTVQTGPEGVLGAVVVGGGWRKTNVGFDRPLKDFHGKAL